MIKETSIEITCATVSRFPGRLAQCHFRKATDTTTNALGALSPRTQLGMILEARRADVDEGWSCQESLMLERELVGVTQHVARPL